MSPNQKILEISKSAIDLANQTRILHEEYDLDLFYFHNGGTFKITKEFLSYIKTIKDLMFDETVIIIDENGTPVLIENINLFLDDIVNKHIQANNKFFYKHQELKNSVNLESILK